MSLVFKSHVWENKDDTPPTKMGASLSCTGTCAEYRDDEHGIYRRQGIVLCSYLVVTSHRNSIQVFGWNMPAAFAFVHCAVKPVKYRLLRR